MAKKPKRRKTFKTFDGSRIAEGELIQRAMHIAEDLNLGYMAASGEYDTSIEITDDPKAQENPWPEIGRFMIFGMTDDYDDGWVYFCNTPAQVINRIQKMVGDEWGFCGLYDLCQENWMDNIAVMITVRFTLFDGIVEG